MFRSERGSAVVESVFGMAMLLFLALGTIQVALTLYARNVVQAAVHDGARAVVEVGGADTDAETVARAVIERSAGSLLDDLDIETAVDSGGDRLLVHVRATGRLVAPGPIPIGLPITVGSTSSREILDVDG
jgi:hypothetical protein